MGEVISYSSPLQLYIDNDTTLTEESLGWQIRVTNHSIHIANKISGSCGVKRHLTRQTQFLPACLLSWSSMTSSAATASPGCCLNLNQSPRLERTAEGAILPSPDDTQSFVSSSALSAHNLLKRRLEATGRFYKNGIAVRWLGCSI